MAHLSHVSLVVCAGFLPATANAYCPGWDKTLPNYDRHYYSVEHEFMRSAFVVEATAEDEIWLGADGKPKKLAGPFQFGKRRPWGFDPYVGAYYDLHVVKSFKGHAPSHLRLFSENSTARFWLERGVPYLLFVTKERFDPPVEFANTIDNCGNFLTFPLRASVAGKLRKLSRATSR